MTDCNASALASVRAEIDLIDDSILDLIERRFVAAAAIARIKEGEEDGALKLRPRRQSAVIARLQARARNAPPEAVAAVWRELMAHSLQAQAPMEIVLAGTGDRELIEAEVRARFGSAAPLRWANDTDEALRRARESEALAVVADPLPPEECGLTRIETLRGPAGEAVAHALGRVALHDSAEAGAAQQSWSPLSWRSRRALQMPVWPDAGALAKAEESIAAEAPLVPMAQVAGLRKALAAVAEGRGFLLQGGDCAESFAEFSPEKVRRDERLLLAMGSLIGSAAGPVVHVARAAGQFAKPRSAPGETSAGVTLPSYRGDAVNGRAFTAASRTPNPERLIEAHRQARATLGLLSAYRQADRGEALIHASHEALLLNYEQALTRRDPATGRWWAGSGHMLWIGDRTRGLDDAHVEFARGVMNPIGLKCGPSIGPDDLLRLIERLDPENESGRLVLIGRFGAGEVEAHLPGLMRAVRREGRRVIWSCDPMHGNGRTVGGIKTRLVSDILAETRAFFDAAAAEGVHAGGLHLEMSGMDVTECLGGSCGIGEADLGRHYLSHCDPRLNPAQALDVAGAVARLIVAFRQPRSCAA